MLKEIGSVFSFLTIIPTGNSNLETVAKYMYLFPIVGITIGLLVGSIGFGLSFFLDPLVVSLLVVASLTLITGIHHTDGLADFADGLMKKGTRKKTCCNERSCNRISRDCHHRFVSCRADCCYITLHRPSIVFSNFSK